MLINVSFNIVKKKKKGMKLLIPARIFLSCDWQPLNRSDTTFGFHHMSPRTQAAHRGKKRAIKSLHPTQSFTHQGAVGNCDSCGSQRE